MKPLSILKTLTASALLLAVASTSQAAVIIDSVTSTAGTSGGTLTSLTVGSTTYTDLTAPDALTSIDTVDYLAVGAAAPTTITGALGGLNLDTGALNYDFTVQFARTVTNDDLFFILNNDGNDKVDAITVQAINSVGADVGSSASFGQINDIPQLIGNRNWNRTGGSTLNNRAIMGRGMTLSDFGLAGNTTVTGFIVSSGGNDPGVVGLAAVPEPGSLALLGLGGVLIASRRRRD